MFSKDKSNSLRKTTDSLLNQAQQLIVKGDYARAEAVCAKALNDWRRSSGAKQEEGRIVTLLGKCYEAQHKYEQAYELYMESLKHLTGATYDDIYTNLLYLNERMGAFDKKKSGDNF
jgi:tetratricopeptide (TPR) repeat protein